jgi:hypothetical protein
MGYVVAVLLALVLLGALTVGAVLFVLWRLRCRNRVVPGQPTMAPLTWLAVPSGPARMHRRLRTAIGVARLAAGMPGADAIIRDLELHAVAVDGHLVLASRLRTGRLPAMRALITQVVGIEGVAHRLATTAVESQRTPALAGETADPLARIAERLDALEAARHDLVRLETSAGLERQPSLVRIPPPA